MLAEQLVHPADDIHSTAWEEVLFKHEDIVTGSYQMTKADGTTAAGSGDRPASLEAEPLGGAIPQADPYIEDLGIQPSELREFRFAGDVDRPETGCTWDGMPFSCSLLSVVLHGQTHAELYINSRSQEGYDAYRVLQGAFSYRVTTATNVKVLDVEDQPDDLSRVEDHYELIASPLAIGDTHIWASTAPDRKKLSSDDLSKLRVATFAQLTDKCKTFIKSLLKSTAEIFDGAYKDAGKEQKKDMQHPPSAMYDDFESLFDAVANQQNGGFWGSQMANVSTMFSEPDSPKSDAAVYLGQFIPYENYMATPGFSGLVKQRSWQLAITRYGLTVIHELFHFTFTDVELARAVAHQRKDPVTFSYSDVFAASAYWNDELKKHCGPEAGQ